VTAAGLEGGPTARQLGVVDLEADRARRDVDRDEVPVLDQGDHTPGRGLGRDVPDRQARGAPGEPAVRHESADLAQAAPLEEGRGVAHLLRARAAARALVADDDDVARRDLLAQDLVDGLLLRLADHGRAGEGPDRRVDARRLDDAAV